MREKLRKYIEKKYGIEAEHPWARYPENETFKAKGCDKWFALIMPVRADKLGRRGTEPIDVVNVKADTEFISMMAGTDGFLPGYHMNKQHWLTVFLDGTVSFEQIARCVDESYGLVSDSPTRRIYEAVKLIPRGYVATYGDVAELAGDRKMARAVGNALHKNDDPDNVPCYRVVNSKGELAGEYVFGGAWEQAKLLEADGIKVEEGRVTPLERYRIQVIDGRAVAPAEK